MSIFGSKFDITGEVLVKYNGKGPSVTVPSGIRSIGREAFYENKDVKSVILPEGLETVCYGAFLRAGLTSVTLPASLKKIETHGFGGCFYLQSLALPTGLTSIGSYAFQCCNKLTELTIPGSVTKIDDNAFLDCTGLRKVTMPERFRARTVAIFGRTCSEKISFNYTAPVTSGKKPAAAKKAAPAIDLGGATMASLGLGDAVKPAAPIEKKPAPPSDMEITDGVLTLYRGTAAEVSVPKGVTAIGKDAFAGNRNILRVTLPDGVMRVGDGAFFCCLALEELILPESVSTLGDDAVMGCRALKKMTLPAALLPRLEALLGKDAVKKMAITALGAPPAPAPAPKPAPVKKTPPVIPPEFKVKDGVLTAYEGTGGEVVIPEGIVKIASDAFSSGCSVTSVTIPVTVTEIEEAAFADLPHLSVIRVAEDNTAYCAHNGALYTKSLDTLLQYPVADRNTSYVAPEGLTDIATGAFYGCRELHYVTLGEGVTGIGPYAFYGCLHLSCVEMAASSIALSDEAFFECPHLLSVTLPEASRGMLAKVFGEVADRDIFRFY